jgi:hypothetical protein
MGGTKEKRRSRPQGCIAGLSLTELRSTTKITDMSFFRPLRVQERMTSQRTQGTDGAVGLRYDKVANRMSSSEATTKNIRVHGGFILLCIWL